MSPEPTRWVSCGIDMEWSTARHRHLTTQMKQDEYTTTFCGATGSPGALRGNTRKPPCPECVKVAKS